MRIMISKRFLIVTILLLSFVLTACSASNSVDGTKKQNDKEDDTTNIIVDDSKHLMIGCYFDPPVTKEAYQTLAESGINTVLVTNNTRRTHSQVLNILDYCDEFGLKCLIALRNNNKVISNSDYMEHESFMGVITVDEPDCAGIDNLVQYIEPLDENYKDKFNFCNLFPYQDASRLGDTWENYVEKYCTTILDNVKSENKVLSVDIYPLQMDARSTFIATKYLYNLETISYAAKAHDAHAHVYIQSMSYDNGTERRLPSEEDFRFQFYTSLAMGFDMISHFCYATPNVNYEFREKDHALLDRDFNLTDQYYYAKNVHDELYKFDSRLLSYDYVGMMPVEGENDPDSEGNFMLLEHGLEKAGNIKNVSSDNDCIIGSFTKNGKNAYVITNFTDPFKKITTNVTLEGLNKITVYEFGVPKEYKADSNGKITITLQPGQGVFVEE